MLNNKDDRLYSHGCKNDRTKDYKNDEHAIVATGLTDSDVLLGRGKRADNHKGNKIFRNIIRSFRSEYESSPRKLKRLVALKVVEKIETLDPPGRFIVEQPFGKIGSKLQCYIETDRKKVLLKVFRALRQKLKKSNTNNTMNSEPACKNNLRQQMKLLEPSETFLKFEPLHPFYEGHFPNEPQHPQKDFSARIPCKSSSKKCYDNSRLNSTGMSILVGNKKVEDCTKTATRCGLRLNGGTENPSGHYDVPFLNEVASTKNSKMQDITGSREQQTFDLKKVPVMSERMHSTQMQGYDKCSDALQIVPTLDSIWNINNSTSNTLAKDLIFKNPGQDKSLCCPHQNDPDQASLNNSKHDFPFLTCPSYTEYMDIIECDLSDLEDWNDTY